MANTFDKIMVYGGITLEYLQINSGIESQATIDSTLAFNYRPTLKSNTLLMTDFINNGSVDAGNVLNLNGDLTGWQIFKKEVGDTTLQFVKEVSIGTTDITDYNVGLNHNYIYTVFPVTATQIGAELLSDVISTDNMWSWSLTSLIPTAIPNQYTAGEIYLFDLNVESSEMQINNDVTQFSNYTKFNKVAKGKRQFTSGAINALLGYIDFNENYIDTVTLRKNFEDFINNDYYKILKNRKGDIYLISTNSLSYKTMDETIEQVTNISFTWQEIGSIENISVTN